MNTVKKMLKSMFVNTKEHDCSKHGLHIFAEATPVSSHNIMLLSDLSGEESEINAVDAIPASCELPECQIATT